ncbi:MAG: hypothetical protein KAI24_08895 [Planctomycetes bacterium]|nr:hypothetical protein [Planctomycetota bacterium]
MSRGRGSWPLLLALVVAFVLAFWWQRSRSTFLRIERQRPAASDIATATGLPLADVFALRDLVGATAPRESWLRAAERYADARRRGSPAEPIRAVTRDDLQARRFELLRERFAARH